MTSSEFLILDAQLDDAEELAALVNSAYRGDGSRSGWTTEADLLDGQRTDPGDIRDRMTPDNHTILTLREHQGGPILGCVLLEFFERDARKTAYLGMLTVKPSLQDRGIGKLLMKAAEERARRSGAEVITLGVIHLRESLMAWYERRGYKKTGLTKPFPYGNVQFGEPLRDDLYFVFFEKSLCHD